MHPRFESFVLVIVASVLFAVSRASAQTPPAATQHEARVSTEVPAEDTNETAWNLSAGGTLNTGNTQAFAGNAGSRFLLKRGFHVFAADAAFTYGVASVRNPDTGVRDPWRQNARNLLGSLRYDRFFTVDDAVFLRTVGRNDRFAGLDLRFQAQLGYARNFFTAEKRRIWAEAGYDFTYDVFVNAQTNADGTTYDGLAQHSVRLFAGYDNRFNEYVQVVMGIEGLIDVVEVDNVRVSSLNEINLKLDGNLKVNLRFNLMFDNVPAQGAASLDTVTIVGLQYTLI